MSRIEDMLNSVPLLEYHPSQFQQSLLLSEGILGSALLHLNYHSNSHLACFECKGVYEHQKGLYVLDCTKKSVTKRGLTIGNTAQLLRKVYDNVQEPRTMHYRSGYFLIYLILGLIFKINNQEIIEEWVILLSYLTSLSEF